MHEMCTNTLKGKIIITPNKKALIKFKLSTLRKIKITHIHTQKKFK